MSRVTLLAGHYGSGKTNIAVNMALSEAAGHPWDASDPRHLRGAESLAIADLDIVNPYFRTEDSRDDLKGAGIRLICSKYANSNVDLPSLPEDLYAITDDKNLRVIIDVGGDDRGALALGRLSQALRKEDDYEMLMVLSCYRPLTPDAEDVLTVMREIEQAGRLPFTGLINNSNLGALTGPEDVLSSLTFAEEAAEKSGLPLRYITVDEAIYKDCCELFARSGREEEKKLLRPLRLQKRPV